MSIGPYPRLTSLDGAQKNFEDQATKLSRYKAKIASDISDLEVQIAVLQSSKISIVAAAAGIAITGASNAPTIGIDGAFTSAAAAPSASNRLQLGGYRSLTSTTAAGGTTGSPLVATDFFVEVNSTTINAVYVPNASTMPDGKIFMIRNNRSDKKIVKIRNTSNADLFDKKLTGLAPFATLTIIRAGAAWRSVSNTTTY